MTATYLIGDVRDRLAEIPTASIDLIVTSPPFLALRSYLPADHPDKAREIGPEGTPAGFLSTLLDLTTEWRRILAPHGSLCVELGDTYSGSGGGGDYMPGGLREGQPGFGGSAGAQREGNAAHWRAKNRDKAAWPLAKSLCGIPTLYPWSLAYGRNLLNPEHTIEPWRIRNLIVWARANPPVGALGDKFRPATSYITVACTGPKRWFDLDAVRTPQQEPSAQTPSPKALAAETLGHHGKGMPATGTYHANGAPPLDWHSDLGDGPNGDRLWHLNTQPYAGSHYATYPEELPRRLIEAMCPRQVCTTCGQPSTRITETTNAVGHAVQRAAHRVGADARDRRTGVASINTAPDRAIVATLGWSDCGHNTWRPGIVLDPFAGSGTTLAVATGLGRHSIGIDHRNADLARERCGMFLEVHQ